MRASSSSSEMASARISLLAQGGNFRGHKIWKYIRLTQDESEQVDPNPVRESFVCGKSSFDAGLWLLTLPLPA